MAQDLLEDILLSSSQTDIPPPTHIHMLCVLKGAGRFYQTLLDCMRKRIQATGTPLRLSLEYIKVKSYSGTQSTGQVSISGCDLQTLTHTHCVIVEDIIDTGNTLRKLVPMLWAEAQPASVRVVALFQKRLGGGEAASSTTTTITTSSTSTHTHTQTQKGQGKSEGKGEKEKTQTQTQTQTVEATVAASTPIPNLSVVGFSLPDKFAVGYGMDLEEEYRDLEHLCLLSPKGIEMHLKK
jgi:hypoxanthine phosphoribosyltransferase